MCLGATRKGFRVGLLDRVCKRGKLVDYLEIPSKRWRRSEYLLCFVNSRLLLRHQVVSDSSDTVDCTQYTRLPCPSAFVAIQPSHLLVLPSPPTLNLSQHQGLFE